MKKKWVDAYMDTAQRFAQLSTAKRLQVGSIIVKDNRIISIGYNGMPYGWSNDCEYEETYMHQPTAGDDYVEVRTGILVTKPEVIHAEANAISKLARDGESGKDAVLFCTHAPCIHCAKLIYGAGIREVYYRDVYRDTKGLEFLEKAKVRIYNINLIVT